MAVLDEVQVVVRAQDARQIDRHRLVQLQRMRRPHEVRTRQHQGVHRGVELHRRLHIDLVQQAVRKRLELRKTVRDHREVDPFRREQLPPLGVQRLVQLDDEVEDVQVVLKEQIVFNVLQPRRPQRMAGDLLDVRPQPGVVLHEGQQFRPDMEVPQDQGVGLGTSERPQAPVDGLVQQAVQVRMVRRDRPEHLHQAEPEEHHRPRHREKPSPRPRPLADQQAPLGHVVDGQTVIQIQRQPRIRILRIEGHPLERIVLDLGGAHAVISSICSA